MNSTNSEEAAGRRVDEKSARSNERLARRYSDDSPSARHNVNLRAQFLQARALAPRSMDGSAGSRSRVA
jgi:hypothetical protein